MSGLFSKPLDSVDADDIRGLVETKRVREHSQLDYKGAPYPHRHSGAVDLLADVTAMANAQGGYVIIGVEEDKTQPDGTPKSTVGIPFADAEANWIQSVCTSSIDERIPDLAVRDIPISAGRSCLIIRVPNSVRKPHMIVHENHRSFRLRHDRVNTMMTMQEVRNMILAMSAYRASLQAFLDSRVEALKATANTMPWLLLMATPIYVDLDKLDPLRTDVRVLLEKVPGVPDQRRYGIITGVPEPRLFGIEAVSPRTLTPSPPTRIIRLYRNGHFEFSTAYQDADGSPSNAKLLPLFAYEISVLLIHFLEVANSLFSLAQITEPIAVTLFLHNIAPSFLHVWEDSTYRPREALLWQETSLNLELTTSDLSQPQATARAIVDRLFNAFGYERSHLFTPEGTFIKAKR